MSETEVLSQEEIDALLMGDSDPSSAKKADESKKVSRPFNPANQHRIIRERLHALDIINERFARGFRMNLFSLLRRTADITVVRMNQLSFQELTRSLPV